MRIRDLLAAGLLILGAQAAVAQTPSVERALRAQVGGLGGCPQPPDARAKSSTFFPSVSFFEGSCEAEHGGTLGALAAVDGAGQVYVLDSPSAYRFFVSEHSPTGVSSTSAVEFAQMALQMSGYASVNETVLDPASVLPNDVSAATGEGRLRLVPPSVSERPSGLEAVFVSIDPNVVKQNRVIVSPNSWDILAFVDTLFVRPAER